MITAYILASILIAYVCAPLVMKAINRYIYETTK